MKEDELKRRVKNLEYEIYVFLNEPNSDEANWFRHCWELRWKKNRNKNLRTLKKYLKTHRIT